MAISTWASIRSLPFNILKFTCTWIGKAITIILDRIILCFIKVLDAFYLDPPPGPWGIGRNIYNTNYQFSWNDISLLPSFIIYNILICITYILYFTYVLLFAILYIIFYPYTYFAKRHQAKRNADIAAGRIRSEPEPKPLPLQSLKRRVSHTRMNFASRDNEKVGLLRLPREVREEIWKELDVGEAKIIHWYTEKRKLRGCVCLRPEIHSCFPASRGGRGELLWWTTTHPFGPDRNFEAWGLLQSCRHLYIEIVEILYTRNTFVTADLDVLVYLDRFLPIQRITQIRHFKFHWELTSSSASTISRSKPSFLTGRELEEANRKIPLAKKAWINVWRNLNNMSGLVSLRVELDIRDMYAMSLWKAGGLEIARPLTRVENFEFVLPAQLKRLLENNQGSDWKDVQFLVFGQEAKSKGIKRFPW